MICIFNIAFLTYLWGINGWLPGYLIKGKGIHLEHAGWLSSMPFIAMLAGEVIGAWLSDRSISARPPALSPWRARLLGWRR
jgi:sugar phosphate permease